MSEPVPICAEVVGPIWKLDGESYACTLPAVHVFAENEADRWHYADNCSWLDDQQVDEARRRRAGEA